MLQMSSTLQMATLELSIGSRDLIKWQLSDVVVKLSWYLMLSGNFLMSWLSLYIFMSTEGTLV